MNTCLKTGLLCLALFSQTSRVALAVEPEPAVDLALFKKKTLPAGKWQMNTLLKNPVIRQWIRQSPAKNDTEWPSRLASLRPIIQQWHYVLFLGDWCSDSKELVPYFIRFLEAMEIPSEHIQLFAVGMDKKSPDDAHIHFQLERIPTLIILEQGQDRKEIFRIVEVMEKPYWAHIVRLFQEHAAGNGS